MRQRRLSAFSVLVRRVDQLEHRRAEGVVSQGRQLGAACDHQRVLAFR